MKKKLPHFKLWMYWILIATLVPALRIRYKAKCENIKEVRKIKGPYLIFGSHTTFWDPLFVSMFVRRRVHFVTGETNLRKKIFKYGLSTAGIISKKKGVPEATVIREMTGIARAGGTICIFPESKMTWTGKSQKIVPASAKLVKLLRLPVVISVIHGGFLSKPRWSSKKNRGKVVVEYKVLLSKEEVLEKSVDEINELLIEALAFDDFQYAKDNNLTFKQGTKAESMEKAYFYCPACKQFECMESCGDIFSCKLCGYSVTWNLENELEPLNGVPKYFKNTYEYMELQKEVMKTKVALDEDKIFSDEEAILKDTSDDMKIVANGEIYICKDKLVIGDTILEMEHISSFQVTVSNTIEFKYKGTMYNLTSPMPLFSGIKYLLAIQTMYPQQAELEL